MEEGCPSLADQLATCQQRMGAGRERAAISGTICAVIGGVSSGRVQWLSKPILLVTSSERGGDCIAKGRCRPVVRGRARCMSIAGACKPCRPPPSRRSTAAVLAAARGTGTRPDAATRGGRSAERLAERGARGEPPGEKSAASGLPRGGLGFPHGLMARWQHGIENDLGPTAARSEVNQGLWTSCDMGLLESRPPRRDVSTGGKWQWPVRLSRREPEVYTAVIDGKTTQFEPRRRVSGRTSEVRQRKLSPMPGAAQVDREGNEVDMRVF